jgi:hypothetical protein
MRFGEGFIYGASRRISVCSLATPRKFREGFQLAFRTPVAAPEMRGRAAVKARGRLLLDDPDFDLWMHVGVEADLHPIDAQRADRLVQLDLALLDLEALRFELVLDIGRSD